MLVAEQRPALTDLEAEKRNPLSNSRPGTSSASRTLSQVILTTEEIPLSSLSAPRLARKSAVFREGYMCW